MKKKRLMQLFAGTFALWLTCSSVLLSSGIKVLAADNKAEEGVAQEASADYEAEESVVIETPADYEAEKIVQQEVPADTAANAATAPEDDTTILKNPKIKYLSDLQEESGSYTGYWGNTVQKDCVNGGQDNLQVRHNGYELNFEKGISAHAKSEVIYDLTKLEEKYKFFVGYLGIDQRAGVSSDGVIFKIYFSDDKKAWGEAVYDSGVVTKQDAKYVKIPLQKKKYIKLVAEQNKTTAADHAVYANAGFVEENYTQSTGYEHLPVKSVEEYDEELKKVDYNSKDAVNQNALKIYQRELVSQAGFYTINNVYTMQGGIYKNAMDYLLKNEEALSYYINGGPKPKEGNYRNSLIAFGKIYNQHHADFDEGKDDFSLRLAVSVASVYANTEGVVFWTLPYKDPDPARRYKTFKDLSAPGGMMDKGADQAKTNEISVGKWSAQEFRNLSVPMMRWVVDSRMNEDEFEWLANYTVNWGKKHSGEKEDNFLDSYMYVKNKQAPWNYEDEKYYSEANREKYTKKYELTGYFDTDRQYGASVGDKKIVRSWIVWEEGGVCGSYAKTYTNLAEVFGRPSVTCGQPGHAAAITWQWNEKGGKDGQGQYEWRIQNDVSNWRNTHSEMSDYILGWGNRSKDHHPSSYVMLATDVLEGKWDTYVEAKKYTLLANSFTDPTKKEAILKKALEKEPEFLDAWYSKMDMKLADSNLSSEDARKFAEEIIERFQYYPMVMSDLLNEISVKLTDEKDKFAVETLRLQALERAAALKDNEYDKADTRQPWVARIVAEGLLNKDTSAFATFSFDGEDAGNIVINEKYNNSTLHVKYSLDNEKTWKDVTLEAGQPHKISLNDQLDSIKPETDIKVSLEGTTVVHVIDILSQQSPKDKKVYLNDDEDLFVGSVEHLQYKAGNVQEWTAYPQNGLNNDLRFTGNQDVSIRYAAHGRYVTSEECAGYKFTESKDSPDNKYLQLRNVTLHKYSSQNNDRSEAAKNIIDGNANTHYHSSYSGDQTRELEFVFDKPRHISSIGYLPYGSGNGCVQTAAIYGSNDGKEWTLLKKEELAKDDKLKIITLPTDTAWQYIKVKGERTYSHDQNPNKYFSGKMISFYEDTTKDIVKAPMNVTAKDITETSAVVSWDAAEGVKGYQIGRAHV